MDETATEGPLRRLLRYSRAHRGNLRLAVTCSVLNKVFDLAPPILIGAAVHVVVKREKSFLADWGIASIESQLVWLAVATLVIWGLESLFQYWHGLLWRNLAQTVQHELRIDAYAHVQKLELAWFEDRSTGGLMAILNDDVNQLERFLDVGANEILQVLTTVVVIGAIFFGAAPGVAVLAFLPIPIVLWGSFKFQRKIAPRYAAVRERASDLGGQLSNNLSGVATVKSFTAEDHEVERIAGLSEAYAASNRHAVKLSAAFSPLIRMAIVVGFVGTLVWGGLEAAGGRLDEGVYSTMVFMTQRLLWPLTRLGETVDLYHRAMASSNRAFGVLDTKPAIVDGPRPLARDAVRGELRLEDVAFRYHSTVSILDGLSLHFPAGETTAIVGPTGSGKSTIVKLLLRFYEPTSGRVTLDGIDLRELRLDDLRHAVGLVSQDVFLLHGSVRENIAYGRRDATDAQIEEAARTAEADAFIRELPYGYDTVVGERGQKLSGGQRQRVSIARAILKDPPVLILDEATSSVDNETEAAIQRSFARISKGRTTIVIAHRLSTVVDADRIYVLDRGRLTEEGHHEDLLASAGIYANLWNVQTGQAAKLPT